MKIYTDHGYDKDFIATDDQVTNTVNKFKNHPTIIRIKNKNKNDQSFSFGSDVLKKIKKASYQSDILTKNSKQNSDYFAEYFYENTNQCSSNSISPSDEKLIYVTPIYKKKLGNFKDKCRPDSILCRCIYDTLFLFFYL